MPNRASSPKNGAMNRRSVPMGECRSASNDWKITQQFFCFQFVGEPMPDKRESNRSFYRQNRLFSKLRLNPEMQRIEIRKGIYLHSLPSVINPSLRSLFSLRNYLSLCFQRWFLFRRMGCGVAIRGTRQTGFLLPDRLFFVPSSLVHPSHAEHIIRHRRTATVLLSVAVALWATCS